MLPGKPAGRNRRVRGWQPSGDGSPPVTAALRYCHSVQQAGCHLQSRLLPPAKGVLAVPGTPTNTSSSRGERSPTFGEGAGGTAERGGHLGSTGEQGDPGSDLSPRSNPSQCSLPAVIFRLLFLDALSTSCLTPCPAPSVSGHLPLSPQRLG